MKDKNSRIHTAKVKDRCYILENRQKVFEMWFLTIEKKIIIRRYARITKVISPPKILDEALNFLLMEQLNPLLQS